MEERGNKTIMCSVMFLDIVAYSKKSVSAQIAQKELFNSILAKAISHVPTDDRVILDTGDGAAITFLGDVEDALKSALAVREGLLTEGASMDPPLQVCIGINLGPVRLVKDINGRPNIVGDGINVAQRVMGFSKAGQILVSRSYFDAASRLAKEYTGMFRREGTRADKHDRVHEVYSIGTQGDADAAKEIGEDTLGLAVKLSPVAHVTGKLQVGVDKFKNASPQQRALYSAIAATTLTLLIVIGVKITSPQSDTKSSEATEATLTQSATTASAVAAAPIVDTEPRDTGQNESPEKQKSTHSKDKLASKKKDSKSSESKSGSTKPVTMAVVDFAVLPWGELYLDGSKQGVSPPLDKLNVMPGKHVIEIRNTTFPPYILSIDVKDGEKLKVKYKFGN